MNKVSRAEFLRMMGAMAAIPAIPAKHKNLLLSFSTLGCPDWNLEQILDFAARHNYQGIEIRGLQRELDLTKTKYFDSPESIRNTKKLFEDKGLKIADLGASCELHYADPDKRQQNLEDARRFATLAAALGCPYIRVFPNKLPTNQDREQTLALIAEGLNALGDSAPPGVKILMETHGDLVHVEDILKVMNKVESPNTGLVWDISNMWFETREPVSSVYEKLKKYIFHTHIKDRDIVKGVDTSVLLGKGQVPIFEAIGLLIKNNYKGYFSFEWEKLWQPNLAAPEIALADYPKAMRKHF